MAICTVKPMAAPTRSSFAAASRLRASKPSGTLSRAASGATSTVSATSRMTRILTGTSTFDSIGAVIMKPVRRRKTHASRAIIGTSLSISKFMGQPIIPGMLSNSERV